MNFAHLPHTHSPLFTGSARRMFPIIMMVQLAVLRNVVIKHPMDLSTIGKKMKSATYDSKDQFLADLQLIHDNCFSYNTNPESPFRMHARELRERWLILANNIPDIRIHRRHDCKTSILSYDDDDLHVGARETIKEDFPMADPSDCPSLARHPKLLGVICDYPEFEGPCNQIPEPQIFQWKPSHKKRSAWNPRHLIRCASFISRESLDNISKSMAECSTIHVQGWWQARQLSLAFLSMASLARSCPAWTSSARAVLLDCLQHFISKIIRGFREELYSTSASSDDSLEVVLAANFSINYRMF